MRGVYFGVFPPLIRYFYFLQLNRFTLSWHTSARAEAGLFSSYTVLKVGGVIQYDPDE